MIRRSLLRDVLVVALVSYSGMLSGIVTVVPFVIFPKFCGHRTLIAPLADHSANTSGLDFLTFSSSLDLLQTLLCCMSQILSFFNLFLKANQLIGLTTYIFVCPLPKFLIPPRCVFGSYQTFTVNYSTSRISSLMTTTVFTIGAEAT